MWTVRVLFPRLVLTRHSQFPVEPGWMLDMVRALRGGRRQRLRSLRWESSREGGGIPGNKPSS